MEFSFNTHEILSRCTIASAKEVVEYINIKSFSRDKHLRLVIMQAFNAPRVD